MTHRRWFASMAVGALACAATIPAQVAVRDADAACRVCHPAAVRAVERTPHAPLLRFEASGELRGACTSCHGDLRAHVTSAADPMAVRVAVAPVTAAACARCHPGRDLAPVRGAHTLLAVPPPAATPARERDDARLDALARAQDRGAIQWSGLLDLGYRLVHQSGSRQGYATDVDLEPGVRARELELRGSGDDGAAFDEFWLRGQDLGDPRWRADTALRDDDTGSLRAEFHRDRLRYDSRSDWHRVDRSVRAGRADVELELGGGLQAFGSFAQHDEAGFWLTERVGNRNVSVQSFVTGVASPREARGDTGELGITGRSTDWTWTLAANYRDERAQDRWTYSQPSVVNPAFPESEDFTSRSSLRGPGGRFSLHGSAAPLSIDAVLRWFEHDRRVTARGDAAGFDVAQFTTATTALGRGDARTWLADLTATLDVSAAVQLVLDLSWRDHREDLLLQQTDTTVFPTLSTTVTVDTIADQHTAQRRLDGAATLQWAAADRLDLGLGYGFAREQLRVPDVDPSDPRNFRAGTARDQGLLGDARWRPFADWTVRAAFRAFAQDGVLLHELAPEEAREESGSIGYAAGGKRATAFVRHRRNENDLSQHRLDSLATGVTAGADRDGISLDAAWTFARVDTATLTNFYFDPDPNPVPTFVGFAGDTNTVSGTVALHPSADVQWRLVGAYATTTGDFDVSTLDWRADLRVQLGGPERAVGTEFRHSYYKASGGFDDWSAQSVFVYWRQVF